MKNFLKFVSIVAVGGFSILTGRAATIAITNPGFESPTIGGYIEGAISGWSIVGEAGVWRPSTYYTTFSAYAGDQAGFIGNGGGVSGTVSQVLSATLQPNTRYDLGIYIGGRPDYSPGVNYSVKLFAGATELAAVTPITPLVGEWVHVTGQYISGNSVSSDLLRIEIHDPLTVTGHDQLTFDNVSLMATVPEGGLTIMFLGLGVASLGAFRSKRN